MTLTLSLSVIKMKMITHTNPTKFIMLAMVLSACLLQPTTASFDPDTISSVQTCNRCNGEKEILVPIRCEECHGEGEVKCTKYLWEQCKICNGEKTIPTPTPCEECQGKGKVPTCRFPEHKSAKFGTADKTGTCDTNSCVYAIHKGEKAMFCEACNWILCPQCISKRMSTIDQPFRVEWTDMDGDNLALTRFGWRQGLRFTCKRNQTLVFTIKTVTAVIVRQDKKYGDKALSFKGNNGENHITNVGPVGIELKVGDRIEVNYMENIWLPATCTTTWHMDQQQVQRRYYTVTYDDNPDKECKALPKDIRRFFENEAAVHSQISKLAELCNVPLSIEEPSFVEWMDMDGEKNCLERFNGRQGLRYTCDGRMGEVKIENVTAVKVKTSKRYGAKALTFECDKRCTTCNNKGEVDFYPPQTFGEDLVLTKEDCTNEDNIYLGKHLHQCRAICPLCPQNRVTNVGTFGRTSVGKDVAVVHSQIAKLAELCHVPQDGLITRRRLTQGTFPPFAALAQQTAASSASSVHDRSRFPAKDEHRQ